MTTNNASHPNTNANFARYNREFHAACAQAGIPPTTRQASKYRRKRGLAYTKGRAE